MGSTEALQQHAALVAEQSALGQMKRSVSFWLGAGASAEVEAIAEVLEDEEGGCSAEGSTIQHRSGCAGEQAAPLEEDQQQHWLENATGESNQTACGRRQLVEGDAPSIAMVCCRLLRRA